MSAGPGRLQRRILELLEKAPRRKRSRLELDQVLVEGEGFDASNVLRAVRGLARNHRVGFTDRRHKKDAVIWLPRRAEVLSDDEITQLLTEANEEVRQ